MFYSKREHLNGANRVHYSHHQTIGDKLDQGRIIPLPPTQFYLQSETEKISLKDVWLEFSTRETAARRNAA